MIVRPYVKRDPIAFPDILRTPVKAVYSNWMLGRHTSLNIFSHWSVDYAPGLWAEPTLKGSKLFYYTSLQSAYYQWGSNYFMKSQRFLLIGLTLWWCAVHEPCQIGGIKLCPKDNDIETFWAYRSGLFFTGATPGVLGARAIQLVSLVTPEDVQKMIRLTNGGPEV